jgi:hypothetical protein
VIANEGGIPAFGDALPARRGCAEDADVSSYAQQL